eukprot:1133049-Rhodomonas_salina.1
MHNGEDRLEMANRRNTPSSGPGLATGSASGVPNLSATPATSRLRLPVVPQAEPLAGRGRRDGGPSPGLTSSVTQVIWAVARLGAPISEPQSLSPRPWY